MIEDGGNENFNVQLGVPSEFGLFGLPVEFEKLGGESLCGSCDFAGSVRVFIVASAYI